MSSDYEYISDTIFVATFSKLCFCIVVHNLGVRDFCQSLDVRVVAAKCYGEEVASKL